MAIAANSPNVATRLAECFSLAEAITPNDTAKIGPYSAFYVGVSGHVTVVPRNSTTAVQFKNVPQGTIIRLAIQAVTTASTATDIVGLA